MKSFLRSCVPLSLLTFVCFVAGGARPASARNIKQYIAVRRAHHYDQALTYAQLEQNGARYTGRVLELRGVVGGIAESGNACTIMLNLSDNAAPALELTKADLDVLRDSSTPHIRVLVEVQEGGGSNVVPLKVLAAASEYEVKAVDAEEAAQQASATRRLQTSRAQVQTLRASSGRVSGASVYRGGYFRQPAPSGDARTLAAFYEPMLGTRVRNCFPAYFDHVLAQNPRLDTGTAGKIAFHLLDFADKYNVDPRLIVAMIEAESGFDPASTSHSGAMGLGQLMPETANDLGVRNGYDVQQNLGGSIYYLRTRLDTFRDKAGGDGAQMIRLAMAAYNAGENAVKKYNGVPPYKETQRYVEKVLARFRQLCNGN